MTTNVKELSDEDLDRQLQDLRTRVPIVITKKITKTKQLTQADITRMLQELKQESDQNDYT